MQILSRLKKHPYLFSASLLIPFGAIGIFLFVNERNFRNTETTQAKLGDLAEAVYGLGTVTANQSFQLKLGVTSTIRKFFVREGETISKGTPLILSDDGQTFRSPFDGTVTSIPFKTGEMIYPQVPIVTVMNLKDRYVAVSLEQEGALRIHPGQIAQMSFETLRGQKFTGKVRTLFPRDNQFMVYIDVADLPDEVIPGMTGDVAIEIARRSGVLMVPLSSVQSGKIIVRKNGLSRKVPVTLGAVDGRWAEVTAGDVKAGDLVLLPQR